MPQPVSMTRAQYQATYGSPPPVPDASNQQSPTAPAQTSAPVKMTRAEYQQKYGQAPTIPGDTGTQTSTSTDAGFGGDISEGNYGGAAKDAVEGVGNFLFPIVGDIGADIQGKSDKTALQQTGDAALSILPFIPGLGELGEGARGVEAAAEGGEAIADAAKGGQAVADASKGSGIVQKTVQKALSGKGIVGGATTGYGMGVASNLSQGQSFGQAVNPLDINNEIGAGLGAVTGGLAGRFGGTGEGSFANSATKDITKVLNPTTKADKAITQKIAPTLAQKGVVSMSREGLLEKYQGNMEKAGEDLENGYQALPQDAKFEVTGLFKNLNQKIDDLHINGKVPSVNQPSVDALTKMSQDLANIGLTTSDDGQQVFSDVANVRKLRQSIDNATRGGFSPTSLDTINKSAQLELSNSIRGEFAKQYPNIAKLNKDFSFWSNASKVLKNTINRKTGQSGIVRKGIAEGVGALGGLPSGHPIIGAGIMRGLSEFINSPAWHTTSAFVKSKLASALENGDGNTVSKFLRAGIASTPGVIGRGAQSFLTELNNPQI